MVFVDAFTHLKDLLGGMLRLGPDALHIHVGIAIFFAVALLVRGPRPFAVAFFVLLALSLATEVFDLLYDLRLGRQLRWLNSVKDIVVAMIWPSAWMLVGARISRLVVPEASIRSPAAEIDNDATSRLVARG